VPRGNTNAPAIAIAERAADLVSGRAPLAAIEPTDAALAAAPPRSASPAQPTPAAPGAAAPGASGIRHRRTRHRSAGRPGPQRRRRRVEIISGYGTSTGKQQQLGAIAAIDARRQARVAGAGRRRAAGAGGRGPPEVRAAPGGGAGGARRRCGRRPREGRAGGGVGGGGGRRVAGAGYL
jgi:hypothetical protein